MPDPFEVRQATEGDAETIAQFNRALARETEGRELDPAVVGAGVRQFLLRPDLGFYIVAEQGAAIAGALMITYEWSDWRNGLFWWIQSVYVRPEYRRRGVFRRLHGHIETLAAGRTGVCGLRLYVEKENHAAQATYLGLGHEATPYLMFEKPLPHTGAFAGVPTPRHLA
jgi:ribosomal protein S18 acetylase RimI-like enzyme